MNLAEAMNTYNIALYIIKNKGFKITLLLDDSEEEITDWKAEKGDTRVFASNPLSLLALVVVAEQYGKDWRSIDTGKLYDAVLHDELFEDEYSTDPPFTEAKDL